MGCRCCGGTFLAARASLQGAPFRGAALAGGEFALQPLCSLMDPASGGPFGEAIDRELFPNCRTVDQDLLQGFISYRSLPEALFYHALSNYRFTSTLHLLCICG